MVENKRSTPLEDFTFRLNRPELKNSRPLSAKDVVAAIRKIDRAILVMIEARDAIYWASRKPLVSPQELLRRLRDRKGKRSRKKRV